MTEIDPLQDFRDILYNNWNISTGGTKPTIEKEMDFRALPINQEFVLVNSLSEGDQFNGIGAVDYIRDVGVNVQVYTNLGRDRLRQMTEECRRMIRKKANWKPNGHMYDRVLMSVTTDLSDERRKDWRISFDVSAIILEAVS